MALPQAAIVGRLLARDVRHAETPADDELGQAQRTHERRHRSQPGQEVVDAEHLRSDVQVEAHQVHRVAGLGAGDRFLGLTGRQRESELRVEVPGSDVLVGVDLDARVDPQQHRRPRRPRRDQRLDAVELVVAVHHEPADTDVEGTAELTGRLVVAVHHQSIGGNAGGHRHVELASGGHVEPEALGMHESGHRPAEERLGGVDDVARSERPDRLPATVPEVVLVVDEQRRAELGRQVTDPDAADLEMSVVGDGGRVGKQRERSASITAVRDLACLCHSVTLLACGHSVTLLACGHIESGAETPSRSSPLRSPTPAASASHHRA